jgi:hypothetical protein
MPTGFKQAMADAQKAQWEEACSKRLLHTWRMPLGDLLSFLPVALQLDRAGCFTSSAPQMAPLSDTRHVWLPKASFSDLVGAMLSRLHPYPTTIRRSVVCACFALVVANDLERDSINITTAFLNGDLEEEIYMKPPEGYKQYSRDGRLLYCLLLKALYGPRQGG